MLNLNEISKKFDTLLASKTKEEIEAWLKFDQQREMLEDMQQAKKTVSGSIEASLEGVKTGNVTTIFDSQAFHEGPLYTADYYKFKNAPKGLFAGESNYAMAA